MAEVFRRPKEEFIEMMKKGTIQRVATVVHSFPEPEKDESFLGKLLLAKEHFGENYFDSSKIGMMEKKCKDAGINVHFELEPGFTKIPFSVDDLIQAKEDEKKGKARMLVYRPGFMTVKRLFRKPESQPITLNNLRRLFRSKNPFWDGKLFFDTGFKNKDFANAQLKSGYAMPTIGPVPDSGSKVFGEQKQMLEPNETRREAIETVWDILIYQANHNSERLIADGYDLTSSELAFGISVRIANFGRHGISLRQHDNKERLGDVRLYSQIKKT